MTPVLDEGGTLLRDRKSLTAVARFYELTNAADVRSYINSHYCPHDVMFDPVAAYVEAVFKPGLTVVAGGRVVTLQLNAATLVIPVAEWHDLLLAQVVNGMTSDDCDLHGFYNVDGQSGADVETLCGLLAVPPVHPLVRMLRRFYNALLRLVA